MCDVLTFNNDSDTLTNASTETSTAEISVEDIIISDDMFLLDDAVLLELIKEYRESIKKRKRLLDRKSCLRDGNNHLEFTVARLYYGFAREEYNALFKEAKKRGLVAQGLV